MQIVVSNPPNFAEVAAVFPMAHKKGVIFTYGEAIYNPSGVFISKALVAHETVHSERQRTEGAQRWWDRYLADAWFRLDEEIYAHHAEYKAMVRRHGPRPADLKCISERLSGPLYGKMIDYAQAQHAILTGEVK